MNLNSDPYHKYETTYKFIYFFRFYVFIIIYSNRVNTNKHSKTLISRVLNITKYDFSAYTNYGSLRIFFFQILHRTGEVKRDAYQVNFTGFSLAF